MSPNAVIKLNNKVHGPLVDLCNRIFFTIDETRSERPNERWEVGELLDGQNVPVWRVAGQPVQEQITGIHLGHDYYQVDPGYPRLDRLREGVLLLQSWQGVRHYYPDVRDVRSEELHQH